MGMIQRIKKVFGKKEFPYDYQFPEIVIKRWKAKEQFSHITPSQFEQAESGLMQFFEVLYFNKTSVAMVSELVDDLWHEFILHTKEYHKFCDTVFGKYIHHHPNEGHVVYDWSDKDVPQSMLNLYKLAKNSPLNIVKGTPIIFTIDEKCRIENGYKFNHERISKQLTPTPKKRDDDDGGDAESGDSSCGGCD